MHATEAKIKINTTLSISPVVSILTVFIFNTSCRAKTKTLSKTHVLRTRGGMSPKKHSSRESGNVSMAVLLETTLGDIVIDLFTEERPKSKNIHTLKTLKTFTHGGGEFDEAAARGVS